MVLKNVIPAYAGIFSTVWIGESFIRRNYHAGSGTKKHEISLYKPSEVCQTSEGYKDFLGMTETEILECTLSLKVNNFF